MLLRIALLTAALTPLASAQTNIFELQSGARNLGRANYTLVRAKDGYKLSSRVSYHINGIETDLDDEFTFSSNYAYQGGFCSSNTQMVTSYTPNKARTELVIGMVQGGAQDSRHLVIKPDFAILPPFDPGAAQALLLLATTHPTADNLYNIVVPGGAPAGPAPGEDQESGRGGSRGGRGIPTNNAYDAVWTKGPRAAGTLDGKPVALRAYVLAAGRNFWTFFADDSGNLMQLDSSMVRASYIRAKFKLDLKPVAVPQ